MKKHTVTAMADESGFHSTSWFSPCSSNDLASRFKQATGTQGYLNKMLF